VVFVANHLTDTGKEDSTGKSRSKYNSNSKQYKIEKNKTSLVHSPLTTFRRETRRAYSTTP